MSTPRQIRLASIDALRGLTVAAMLLVNNAGDWSHVHPWLQHAAWHGITPADYVFPGFLFIVGVSIALALTPRLDAGVNAETLSRQVLARGARIVLLGLVLHLLQWWWVGPERAFRPLGVLQRIGVCYAVAALVVIHWRDARAQWALAGGVVLGYWLLLLAGSTFEPRVNIVDRFDTFVLGSHAYLYDASTGQAQEPEGLLSTLPALATTLLGVRAGAWLRAGDRRRLVAGGVVIWLAGALWTLVLPLNKQLWTPSFVLWTGGFAMLVTALAHELIDRRGAPPVGRSFGVNAITAYASAWVATCALEATGLGRALYTAVFAAPLANFDAWVPSAAFALAFTVLWWLAMAGVYRLGWRISI